MANTADDKIRVGGSGLTVFSWRAGGKSTLALLLTIQNTAPTPVAQAVPVQAITDAVPREIVTARAVGAGTLRLTFYETLNHPIWYQLQKEFQDATNLLDVLKAQLLLDKIICRKIIYNYDGTKPQATRTKSYQK